MGMSPRLGEMSAEWGPQSTETRQNRRPMGTFLTLLTIVIACVVSLVCGLAGLASSASPDVGFAGAGIVLLMLPGALIGIVLAGLIAWRSRSRVVFLILTAVLSYFGGMLPQAFWYVWKIYDHHRTFVYVPAPDFKARLEVSLPGEANVGDVIPIEAKLHQGPWQRVRYSDFLAGHETAYKKYTNAARSVEPPAVDTSVGRQLIFKEVESMRKDFDPVTAQPTLTFWRPGTYTVQASAYDPLDVLSDPVTITIRAPDFVYVPASDYSARLEVTAPAEGVTYETLTATVALRHGPWTRIRFADLSREPYSRFARRFRLKPPPPLDVEAARRCFWQATPQGVNWGQPQGVEANFFFTSPGVYELFAHLAPPGDTEVISEAARITIREK